MKLGKIKFLTIILSLALITNLNAEDKILSAPIINLENLEPSYENLENEKENIKNLNTKIKKRDIIDNKNNNIKFVNLPLCAPTSKIVFILL